MADPVPHSGVFQTGSLDKGTKPQEGRRASGRVRKKQTSKGALLAANVQGSRGLVGDLRPIFLAGPLKGKKLKGGTGQSDLGR